MESVLAALERPVPPSLSPPRAHLAPLLVLMQTQRPDEALQLCEAAIKGEAEQLALLEKRRRDQRRLLFESRYRLTCSLVFLRDQGLLPHRDCASIKDYCERAFPEIKLLQLEKYLLVAERLPEDVVLSGRAGIELLGRIAAIDDAALRGRLCARLRSGEKIRIVSRGARAALSAAGLPSTVALQRMEEALAGRQVRRPQKGTTERFVHDLHGFLAQGAKLLEEADLHDEREQALQQIAAAFGLALSGERRRAPRMDEPSEPAPPAEPAIALYEDPGVPAAAKKPPRRTPYDHQLPVSYPGQDHDPTPAEQHAARAIVALHHAAFHAEQVFLRTRQHGDLVADDLMLHYQHSYGPFSDLRLAVEARIKDAAEPGRIAREERLAAQPDLPEDCLFPVRTDPAQVVLPQSWLTFSVLNPFQDPDPSPAEKEVFFVLALLLVAQEELSRLLCRLDEGHGMADDLIDQLYHGCRAARFQPLRLCALFQHGADEARRQVKARAPEREALRARMERAAANMVVLGEDTVPENWVKIAQSEDGRHVALSLHIGQILVALGAQGVGKSHLGVLLLEALCLALSGVSRLSRPGNAIVFAADWRKGQTRHQHLRGFFPNPDLGQWDHLRDTYGAVCGLHNAAFSRAILGCLPGTAGHYRALYPDLVERGLEIREVRLHPTDWSAFGYHLFLGCAERLKGRTQAQVFLGNLMAQLGPDAPISRIRAEFERARLGGASRPVLAGAFALIEGLTSDHERAADLVAEPGVPVLCYLESARMGADQLLSLQLSIMTALNRPLPEDPYLLYILEEVAKQRVSEELMSAFSEMAKEVRHGQRSLYFGAHLPTDLPADVISMASGVFQFAGTNAAAFRRLRELSPLFAGVRTEEVLQLPPRMAYGGFQRASHPAYVRRPHLYSFRPSCIDAGGETIGRGGAG